MKYLKSAYLLQTSFAPNALSPSPRDEIIPPPQIFRRRREKKATRASDDAQMPLTRAQLPNTHYHGIASLNGALVMGRMRTFLFVLLLFLALPLITQDLFGQSLTNDTYTLSQGETLAADGNGTPGILENDLFLPGQSPAVAWVKEQPQNGSLILNENGTFSYQPRPNFSGTDAFSYRASLGNPLTVLSSRTSWRAFSPRDGRPPALDSPGFNDTWNTLAFNIPRSWVRARGLTGYGMFGETNNGNGFFSGGIPPETNLGLPMNGRRYTAYMRTVFSLGESGTYRISAALRRDDGVIAYLDGKELFRSFEPGALTAKTAPGGYFLMIEGSNLSLTSGPGETAQNVIEVDGVELSEGEHCFAMSIHNAQAANQGNAAASSDLGVQLDTLQLTKTEQAEVSIEVLPSQGTVTGEPDWFSMQPDAVLNTANNNRSLYSNDRLLDESGVPYLEILELQIDDSQAEGTILSSDPQTGNFQFEPTPDFEGLTLLTYRVTTESGQSDPIDLFIWVSSSAPSTDSAPHSISVGSSQQSNLPLPIPISIPAARIVTQPETGTATVTSLRGNAPGWYAIYSAPVTTNYLPRTGSNQFIVEFLPIANRPTWIRLPVQINLISPMQNWRTSTFNQVQLADASISGALADPDQDHYSNLMEYVFNSNPLDSGSSPSAPLTIVSRGSDAVVTTFQQNLPADTMCELQIRGHDDQDWITIGANYGHLNPAFRTGWFTNLGRGNQSTLPRDRSAAIYRYRFSLYPWVTDVPEGQSLDQ